MSETQCDYITSEKFGEDMSFSVPVNLTNKRNFNQISKDSTDEPVAKVAKIDATCVGETSMKRKLSEYKVEEEPVAKVDATCVGETSMKRKLSEYKVVEEPVAKVAKIDATYIDGTSMKCLKRKLAECVESYKMVEEPVAKIVKVDTFSTSLPRVGETSMNCLKRKLTEYGNSNHFRTVKEWYVITGLCGFKNETTLQIVMSRLVEDTFLERVNNKLRVKMI